MVRDGAGVKAPRRLELMRPTPFQVKRCANRRYTGRLLIDGELYTPSEATKKFLKTSG